MEWNEVKAKPKRKTAKKSSDDDGFYGGASGGHLKAGPVKSSGPTKAAVNNQASAIADYDFLRDDLEETKYELVTLECANAIKDARLKKDMTQAQLAKAINEKASTIHDIENGSATYNPHVINSIEKILGVKIPRGRNNKKKPAKKPF